jgi:hypothetical protein
MSKTYRRNDDFKKARRDRNFKKSKKFKQLHVPGSVKHHTTQHTETDTEYEHTDSF